MGLVPRSAPAATTTLTPYASLGTLEIIWVDDTARSREAHQDRLYDRDIAISGVEGISDGVYREIDGDWLLWLRGCVEAALRSKPGTLNRIEQLDAVSTSVDFLQRVAAAGRMAGVMASERLPADYRRPPAEILGWEDGRP